jgi:hypothetical protein
MTSALDGVGAQRHVPAAFTPGKDPVPIVQEAGWAPGPVWIGADNLAPTGIRFPELPARSESLYRLSYSDPCTKLYNTHNTETIVCKLGIIGMPVNKFGVLTRLY